MSDNKRVLLKNGVEIKKYLSEYLGIDSDDLANDDYLKEDLHMNSVEISDFLQLLKNKGVDLNLSQITEINTVQDIIDISSENEEF